MGQASAPLGEFDPIEYINTPRWRTMNLGLDRIRELLQRLGNPQDSLRFVHVAGTNGKGSTCAFISSVLQHAGLKVGLFTSPYIIRFEERIRVNGENISSDDLLAVTLDVRAAAEAMADHPTEFELMTAVAFLHFARQHCDIVVAEVGLGGRLDSTNVIETVEVSVIAPIAIDHSAMLGNTVAEIAAEKAGIMKPGVPVVSAAQTPEAEAVLRSAAQQVKTTISFVDESSIAGAPEDFTVGQWRHLKITLAGTYQRFNAATAILACKALQGAWPITDDDIREGLARATWPGRFEYVHHAPDVIIDGAHNVQGMQVLAHELSLRYEPGSVTFVVGLMADKDYRSMLPNIVPLAARVFCIKPNNPRALPATDLAEAVRCAADEAGCACEAVACETVAEAVQQALESAGAQGTVCFCGSLYAIGDVKAQLAQHSF